MKFPHALAVLSVAIASNSFAATTPMDEINQLQAALVTLKTDYENRINLLEQRLELVEQRAEQAESRNDVIEEKASEALGMAEDATLAPNPVTRAANDFNPAIGLVLIGTAASQTSDQQPTVPGFRQPGDSGIPAQGFALGESELNFNANVDDKFFGNLTVALASSDSGTEAEVEEAYIQSLAIPYGVNITAGRFFSDIGYLNGFHAHADDFADRPLAYQMFLGGQYKDDGVKVKWILPTSSYVEIGGELLRGATFPAAGAARDGRGAWSLFAQTGGDIGISTSWKLGLGFLRAMVVDQPIEPATESTDLFTGDSDLYNFSFVWKWAPDGNSVNTNFKLQGEYFWRDEDGLIAGENYSGNQAGWYVQSLWQFRPQWRVGYRYDRVLSDNKPATVNSLRDANHLLYQNTMVVEWANSEFSRLRLQYGADKSGVQDDNRWVLQYIHSLGAHGAHNF